MFHLPSQHLCLTTLCNQRLGQLHATTHTQPPSPRPLSTNHHLGSGQLNVKIHCLHSSSLLSIKKLSMPSQVLHISIRTSWGKGSGGLSNIAQEGLKGFVTPAPTSFILQSQAKWCALLFRFTQASFNPPRSRWRIDKSLISPTRGWWEKRAGVMPANFLKCIWQLNYTVAIPDNVTSYCD